LKAVYGNDVVATLLHLGDVDAASRRSRELEPLILPGPANLVIPFVGTRARCALMRGDIDGAKGQLGRRDEARSTLESAMGAERLAQLCREGQVLDPERVCALVLA
jgi:hypothetical protein